MTFVQVETRKKTEIASDRSQEVRVRDVDSDRKRPKRPSKIVHEIVRDGRAVRRHRRRPIAGGPGYEN